MLLLRAMLTLKKMARPPKKITPEFCQGQQIAAQIIFYARLSLSYSQNKKGGITANTSLNQFCILLGQKAGLGIQPGSISKYEQRAGMPDHQGILYKIPQEYLEAIVRAVPLIPYTADELFAISTGKFEPYEDQPPLDELINSADPSALGAKFTTDNLRIELEFARQGILMNGAEKILAGVLGLSIRQVKGSAIAALLQKVRGTQKPKPTAVKVLKSMPVESFEEQPSLIDLVLAAPFKAQLHVLKAIVNSLAETFEEPPEPAKEYNLREIIGLQVGAQLLKQARELQNQPVKEFVEAIGASVTESVVLASECAGTVQHGKVQSLDKSYAKFAIESNFIPISYSDFSLIIEGTNQGKYMTLRSLKELIDSAAEMCGDRFKSRCESLGVSEGAIALAREAKIKKGDEETLSAVLELPTNDVIAAQIAQLYQQALPSAQKVIILVKAEL